MQETRQRILELLEERGEVTVQELSQLLGLTSVTVRHHLEILRREGYVSPPRIRRSSKPGRPRHVYSLAPRALDLFPSNYGGLASSLMKALKSQLTVEERLHLLESVGQEMAAGAGDLPNDADARIQTILGYMRQLGFSAEIEKRGEQRYRLIISHCPYRKLSQEHPETCYVDEVMLRVLTGGMLQRLGEERAAQNQRCIYEVILVIPQK